MRKAKALTWCGGFVDPNLLGKGIYTAITPALYPERTTIEDLVTNTEIAKRNLPLGGG